jgi:hypothetical protein
MYDEEYFIQVLKPLMSGPEDPPLERSIFYKYYTDLSEDQIKNYETQHIDPAFASERGTVLGISLPNASNWLVKQDAHPK